MEYENMQPHQQRVVDEKKELDFKRMSLAKFIIDSPLYLKLDPSERERLARQYDVMVAYSDILEERISAFPEV